MAGKWHKIKVMSKTFTLTLEEVYDIKKQLDKIDFSPEPKPNHDKLYKIIYGPYGGEGEDHY